MLYAENLHDAEQASIVNLAAHHEALQALARLRKEAREEINRLIEFLDGTVDTDEDSQVDDGPVDDDDLGPSLDATNIRNQEKCFKMREGDWYRMDLEEEHDGREPDPDFEDGGDDEPSLGAPEPLEPEPGTLIFHAGKFYPVDDEDRAEVYKQGTPWMGYGDRDLEVDGTEQEVGDDYLEVGEDEYAI